MPYIKKTLRDKLDEPIMELATVLGLEAPGDGHSISPGALNYVICKLIMNTHDYNYKAMNSAIGALACAKQELYRRWIAPYKNLKQAENGDLVEWEVWP